MHAWVDSDAIHSQTETEGFLLFMGEKGRSRWRICAYGVGAEEPDFTMKKKPIFSMHRPCSMRSRGPFCRTNELRASRRSNSLPRPGAWARVGDWWPRRGLEIPACWTTAVAADGRRRSGPRPGAYLKTTRG